MAVLEVDTHHLKKVDMLKVFTDRFGRGVRRRKAHHKVPCGTVAFDLAADVSRKEMLFVVPEHLDLRTISTHLCYHEY